jgi:biotin carboxyl carrier protein
MSKRLNKRQQREAEELAELQRAQVQAQASVRPDLDEEEQDEQPAEPSQKQEDEQPAESEEEEEQLTRKSGGKVLNPFAAVSLGQIPEA